MIRGEPIGGTEGDCTDVADFTEANGYLTPSLKVKRARVLTDFARDIDAIYASRTS